MLEDEYKNYSQALSSASQSLRKGKSMANYKFTNHSMRKIVSCSLFDESIPINSVMIVLGQRWQSPQVNLAQPCCCCVDVP